MVKYEAKYSAKAEAELAAFLSRFYDDPLGFVMAAYPWGVPFLPDGSLNPLRNRQGPEPWQRKLLIKLGEHIKENVKRHQVGLDYLLWRSAVASGHGVGKSALVCWLIHFLMTTRANTRGVVTANTQRQLEDKTWPELAKWHQLFIAKHWFVWTATQYYFAPYPEDQRKRYLTTALTVSAENTEAFAGLHNDEGTVFNIFDEASGIADKIWEVAQGASTDGEFFFFAYGNPTQTDGQFKRCFDDEFDDMYYTDHVDSREVSFTNKNALNDIIRLYGADSDEAKVRVYGQFPSRSFNGFISLDLVAEAQAREHFYDSGAPLIMAVDVARFGDDETVIGWRQGHDARSRPWLYFKGLSSTRVAEIVAREANIHKPDAIVIEGTGPGIGVVDQLKDRGYRVIEVYPGAPSSDAEHYSRKRDELWGKGREALAKGLCIGGDPLLAQQLTMMQYSFDGNGQKYKLEKKEDYKKRTGLPSPDRADTLMLTFGVELARRDSRASRANTGRDTRAISAYDEFSL